MKKLLSLLLVIALITASFAACGAKDDPTADGPAGNEIQQDGDLASDAETTEGSGETGDADAAIGEGGGPADSSQDQPSQKPSESNTDKPADKTPETGNKPSEPADTLPPDAEKLPDEPDNAENEAAEESLGSQLKAIFDKSSETDPSKMADELINACAELTQITLVKESIEEGGWMPGFDAEITGYTEAAMFAPMIGSIAFVGYVCKTDDPAALEKTMKDNANPAWNICVRAEEMVSSTRGNLVFFLMCP